MNPLLRSDKNVLARLVNRFAIDMLLFAFSFFGPTSSFFFYIRHTLFAHSQLPNSLMQNDSVKYNNVFAKTKDLVLLQIAENILELHV